MNITIIGGGFAGVKSALELAKDSRNHITLITDKPDFQYYPALYSSATGHSHAESWAPLGEIFGEHTNIHVFIDTVKSLQAKSKTITGVSGTTYHFETLIIAIGVVTAYYNIPGLETYAFGIKSHDEIQRLKQRLFIDIAERGLLDKNYVVIGAGPTGVELAAALGTYIQRLCVRYGVKKHSIRVRLIEAAPRVLPRSSEQTSHAVTQRLKKLGVHVETGKKVEKENAKQLVVSGRPIESHTVIWTSGVTNHPFFAAHPMVFTLAPNKRVVVDGHMMAHDNIYVIGDNADTKYTGLAQTALHDAQYIAKHLKRIADGKKLVPYKAVLPASAVPVGKNWAVLEWKSIRIYGFLGGLIRRAADWIGYSDLMPFGMSLGAWRASTVYENDYFTPTLKRHKRRK
ncbi:FAD-dependent oxidoreductase [Microbacteriaceae bacterium]|nr:FAD-dependent oxidoreductase [Candidatus Saccharibacteria bacterium]